MKYNMIREINIQHTPLLIKTNHHQWLSNDYNGKNCLYLASSIVSSRSSPSNFMSLVTATLFTVPVSKQTNY